MTDSRERRGRLLIADDDLNTREALLEFLGARYECVMVGSAAAALPLLAAGQFDLIISDIGMRGLTGLELVPRALAAAPDTVIILLSGQRTTEQAVAALRAGAFDYLLKPLAPAQVAAAVERALAHHALLAAKRRHECQLEQEIAQRTTELNRALGSVADAYRATLTALVAALEARDHETHGHSTRVVQISLRLGHELRLDEEPLRALEFGALLHDIGKIGVPDAILRKPTTLTAAEWTRMRQHPQLGAQILAGIDFLAGAARVVGQHHERWDGSGYPAGLRGAQIDLNARIFAVADAFDAITSDRVYRAGKSYEAAAAELDAHAGQQFDPQVVAAFHRVPRADWDELRRLALIKWREREAALPLERGQDVLV